MPSDVYMYLSKCTCNHIHAYVTCALSVQMYVICTAEECADKKLLQFKCESLL